MSSNGGGIADAHRAALANARIEIAAAQCDDEGVRSRMLTFCAAHPDALWRTCREGHLTGSALVVEPRSRQVLLLHHARLQRWLQPGGHADGDGDLARVALREAMEETGLEGLRLLPRAIDLDVHEIPARCDEPAHLHLDVRYLVLAPSLKHRINEESTDARWFDPVADAAEIGSGEVARLVMAGLRRLGSTEMPGAPG